MRHRKHQHTLGVKKEHRSALLANLASALIRHGRIQTTLAKAKALRPFVEKIITFAKKAAAAQDKAQKLHLRRLALARLRDESAARILFNERAEEFKNRDGGYTRIYKLVPRKGDAAERGLIELIPASDKGYRNESKRRKPASKKAAPKSSAKTTTKKTAKPAVAATSETAPTEPSENPKE